MNKTVLKYTLASVIAAAIAFVVMCLRDLFHKTDMQSVCSVLCDAFTVPGLLYLLFGALVLIAREGTFDVLGYAVRSLFNRFKSEAEFKKRESFYDYTVRKRKEHSEGKSIAFLFIVGLIFSAVAVVFLILYHVA